MSDSAFPDSHCAVDSKDAGHPVEELLLSGLEISASLFHLGQYCNQWESSLHGHQRAGFHVVLHGPCWLHIQHQEALALQAGDAVFFLRDVPHRLSSSPTPPDWNAAMRRQTMQSLEPQVPHSTGLLCGFLDLGRGLSELLLATVPDVLLIDGSQTDADSGRPLLDLIQAEMRRQPQANSSLLEKLVELLLFYTLRQQIGQTPAEGALPAGLIHLASDPAFGGLIEQLLREPAKAWSVDDMAAYLNMSRAAFHRRFTLLCGMAPAQVLLHLRMQLAKRQLEQGLTMEQIAERIGYSSAAAFSAAFRRSVGLSPAQWRKQDARP
ncbi:AraC family transcriptional regulator [Alcaligenes faecalis]|uniref:AraC family transcriptional regulator n=1 Tax=Alcaligenes faecalis TaxID=511 RepID=UPI000E13A7F3|nr:AraC family transcriptional regulator [Alcaligenes faecalis]SSY85585.1 Urease operon transcriptional activator [Alcaligenes faecalis subsp. faecalis]